ncbi:MAG: lysophospholipid acyltransferase family protein [Rhodospirillaceae bacterium]|jgi:lysophospholipid acyltransferase (LPLAT)-like uncharacterized protein|nr:lysophospholipid acyltransferase family protein [Rhodospirillaceae bacterium]MBT6118160.1 lysophospholipid acyltransferase family protein [Rhodospirillaceae bacterium]
MRFLRGLHRRPPVRRAIAALVAGYVRLVHATSRWTMEGEEHARAGGESFIFCFWHGRMLMLPPAWKAGRPVRMLISRHADGRLIAEVIRRFGIGTVAGSSTKGRVSAVREILRAVEAGTCIGITPDGPRGPRMRAQGGAIALARRAGVPILPASYAVRRRKILASWDRFVLPWPFNRGVYIWGEPLHVPPEAGPEKEEALRAELERRLNAVTEEADALCGHGPPEPGPPRPRRANETAPRTGTEGGR